MAQVKINRFKKEALEKNTKGRYNKICAFVVIINYKILLYILITGYDNVY